MKRDYNLIDDVFSDQNDEKQSFFNSLYEIIKEKSLSIFYALRNMFINKYNVVKLPQIKPYEYSDVSERMFYSNMELIKQFVEKENPEKHILWYEEKGHKHRGHKMFDSKLEGLTLFDESTCNMWVMDVIKKIYNWYSNEYNILNRDEKYLNDIIHSYIVGSAKFVLVDDNECTSGMSNNFYELRYDNTKCPKNLDELYKYNVDWNILDKYIGNNRNNFFKENYMKNKLYELQKEKYRQKQYYLHLCIDVRPYLWV